MSADLPSLPEALASSGVEILKKKHGGKRKGAGKPKGVLWPSTLDKLAAREYVRQKITAALDPILDAHIANAIGRRYLVKRDKRTGKFIGVTEAMAKAELGSDEEIIEVWEKDPSAQASMDLLNRAIDKPKEQEQEVDLKAEIVITWQ